MKRALVHRFTDIWRTDLGHKVRVSLQDAPDVSQEADFVPRRIAVVEKGDFVKAGTVISGKAGSYLLIEQGELTDVLRFRAMKISHWLPWATAATSLNPVTGMQEAAPPRLFQVKLPVVIEPLRSIKEKGIERPKNAIFTGALVEVGHKVGAFEIHNVVQMLGVRQLEAY